MWKYSNSWKILESVLANLGDAADVGYSHALHMLERWGSRVRVGHVQPFDPVRVVWGSPLEFLPVSSCSPNSWSVHFQHLLEDYSSSHFSGTECDTAVICRVTEWQNDRMTLFIIDVSYIFIFFFFFSINSIFSINIHTESGQKNHWFRKWEDYLKKYTKSCSYPNWVIIQYYYPSLHNFRSVQKWNMLRSNCNKVFDFLFDRVKTYIF